ncbi:HAD family hydrolase [Photobacterium aphoticum]|uniref:HAD family hydrolase n=1 Tax=Photobacterium aphoticum TaxID=754436 RepID=A0A0J1JEY8_9GAMM|nr:HAD-IA family hydrolase [Photobacterium aphoticum]KLV00222.1 HAD family hydrolase [Photobacterium aphoticum]PSU56591.1 phosphoglycolate phosphatase [Photobacterium aphoticum]GHA55973.1 phosphoglycolate phosphatase [Photobacterium aphoticum]
MANHLHAVLFDLDGTLLDTAPDMAKAANRVLADYNLPPLTAAHIQANTSYGAKGLLTAGFGTHPLPSDMTMLRQRFLDYYEQNICEHTALYPGIAALLDHLDATQIPWGIMTNKPGFLTDMLLPYFPHLMRAHAIVCGDTLPLAKPHPEPLWYSCECMGVNAAQCAYIGDIEKDMIAASAANMAGYVAGWGYIGEADRPDKWDAHGILRHPSELIRHLSPSA